MTRNTTTAPRTTTRTRKTATVPATATVTVPVPVTPETQTAPVAAPLDATTVPATPVVTIADDGAVTIADNSAGTDSPPVADGVPLADAVAIVCGTPDTADAVALGIALYRAVPAASCATVRALVDSAMRDAIGSGNFVAAGIAHAVGAAFDGARSATNAAPVRTADDYARVIIARRLYARFIAECMPSDVPADMAGAVSKLSSVTSGELFDSVNAMVGNASLRELLGADAAAIDAALTRSAFRRVGSNNVREFVIARVAALGAGFHTVRAVTRVADDAGYAPSDGAMAAWVNRVAADPAGPAAIDGVTVTIAGPGRRAGITVA
jgi:hypothetical protein